MSVLFFFFVFFPIFHSRISRWITTSSGVFRYPGESDFADSVYGRADFSTLAPPTTSDVSDQIMLFPDDACIDASGNL